MSNNDTTNTPQPEEDGERHFTTRRGFITTLGFGVVSLYGLWAGYGAAPTSLSFLSEEGSEGMAGMGHGGGGMSPEEFRRLAEQFIDSNRLPDGSVKPGTGMAAMDRDEETEDGHTVKTAEAHTGNGDTHDGSQDVYLISSRYGYEPGVLRLDTGTPYRFRIMAVDANHGASIKMRAAGHIIRCPARTLVEQTLTFTAPGDHLVYCTVYCGEGHDLMMGRIVVA